MKIDVLATHGSPLGVTLRTLWGDEHRPGVGGAEYAILTLCEEWTKAGHTVVFYNDGVNGDIFEHRPVSSFDPTESRDVLIVFRTPNPRAVNAKGKVVWFSTDQRTIGNFGVFSALVDQIVCISPFHVKYFEHVYGIHNAEYIDLPVRINDFYLVEDVKKSKHKLIFTSIPDRGLDQLFLVWNKIKSTVPDASLVITSDFRLWGARSELNQSHRIKWLGQQDVTFLGAIPRVDLLYHLAEAEILPYPSVYEELFCLAVAEASCLGAYPVTSNIGALSTTNMGTIVSGNPFDQSFISDFSDTVINLMLNPDELREKSQKLRKDALLRFSPNTVLNAWNEKVFYNV